MRVKKGKSEFTSGMTNKRATAARPTAKAAGPKGAGGSGGAGCVGVLRLRMMRVAHHAPLRMTSLVERGPEKLIPLGMTDKTAQQRQKQKRIPFRGMTNKRATATAKAKAKAKEDADSLRE